MDNNKKFTVKGLAELQDAVRRNPDNVIKEVATFLTRAVAKYKSTIWNNPWRVGMGGGGVPVATGNLRDTHKVEKGKWEASITPTAPYREKVHTGRPWLTYAFNQNAKEVLLLEQTMLKNITDALAK